MLFSSRRPAFVPYLEKSFETVFELLDYPQDDIRIAAIYALTQFCTSFSAVESPEGQAGNWETQNIIDYRSHLSYGAGAIQNIQNIQNPKYQKLRAPLLFFYEMELNKVYGILLTNKYVLSVIVPFKLGCAYDARVAFMRVNEVGDIWLNIGE